MSGVSAAQRRVLEDLDRGGRGLGAHITATVVPMRCLVRDGLVRVPARRGEDHQLTDAGRAALAAAREHVRLAAGEGFPLDDGPVPVDRDALTAHLARVTEHDEQESEA